MDRFRRILAVYSDRPGADSLLTQAVNLARANNARLTIVRADGVAMSACHVREARRYLGRIVPWVIQQGVSDVETDVLEGVPYKAVSHRVLTGEHDLVVVNADRGSAIKGVMGGGTVRNLLQKCPCAVWILKSDRPAACNAVLAAVDPDTATRDDAGLNARILDLAVTLARSNAASLHAVHCWDVEGSESDMLRSEIHLETKKRILDRHREQRREAVEALLARHTDRAVEAEVHLPRGRPEFELAELAERLSVDTVVMGTAGRSGLSRLVRGEFAEAMLGMVRCGILAVRPYTFHASASYAAVRPAGA
ncbi:MAG: universal stress protein [Alphaproteobacteria bacterium]